MTGVTREYFQLINNHSRAVYSGLVSHEPNTQITRKISQGTTRHTHLFVNLDVSCTVACLQVPCRIVW